ncbi:hypothetical protein HPB48_004082 [Haemaphysalis longicornis]|uniref:TRAF-type domain-containing protein n=1 Tax=Haemaphysalis longicornis TaxID=44386 RepID=A0A9J6GZQ2_HAELO|nr:hypothetical protein HPB48_004082 [Haemaphysalis longicornis]
MQVSCWNHTNGCNIITAAADISRHFHHECGHHMASCPKCSAKILASDVCAHLQSHCDASKMPSEAAIQARQTVCEKQQHPSMTCSDVTKLSRELANCDSMDMSSIQAQLKEISRAFKIVVGDTLSDYAPEDERHSRRSLLKTLLAESRIKGLKNRSG